MTESLASLRRTYSLGSLGDQDVDPNPFRQFARWFAQIRDTSIVEANAMILATASADSIPSARTVLLKGFDDEGLVFYTHYESQKGREIEANPHVAAVFYWPALERQVRISGTVTKTTDAESDAYFVSRPAGSQIAAVASAQSVVVASRESLETRYRELERDVDRGVPVCRPEMWGGYRIGPTEFEFWQGRPNRLHDRIRYQLSDERWGISRLAP